MKLTDLGWNEKLQTEFDEIAKEKQIPARVFSENRGLYILMSEFKELSGSVSGSYHNVLIP